MNNEESAGQKDIECKKIIEKTDYYDILGLNKDATEDEIRKNYKKMAIKFHPDKNSSKFAEDAFKKVSHSFSVLSNKEKKQNYDKFGSEEGMEMPNGGGGFSRDDIDPFDLFNMFMNGSGFNMGGQMGRSQGSSTSYVFSNGNVEYKVFSSFPGNFGGMNGFNQQNSDPDDEDDIFSQILFNSRSSGRRVNENNRKNSNRNQHTQAEREELIKKEKERRQKLINQQIWSQICQSLPLIFFILFVIVPYFLNRFV